MIAARPAPRAPPSHTHGQALWRRLQRACSMGSKSHQQTPIHHLPFPGCEAALRNQTAGLASGIGAARASTSVTLAMGMDGLRKRLRVDPKPWKRPRLPRQCRTNTHPAATRRLCNPHIDLRHPAASNPSARPVSKAAQDHTANPSHIMTRKHPNTYDL